ncbi:MAG: metal-dependent hydrolase [Acidobacteriota bacterium]
MFVGHVALALATKRARPSLSLGWFVAAVTMADLIWPVLLLAGVERVRIGPGAIGATAFTPLVFESYPWSHSLLMLAVWGVLLGVVARWRSRATATDAFVLALLVMSHWALDYITHAPDMPLWPGASPHVGLGLWNSIGGTLIIEGAIWIAGLTIYLRGQRSTAVGVLAFWSFVVVCTAMWASGPWSPLPSSAQALGWLALIGWIMVPWAAFADRYFRPV